MGDAAAPPVRYLLRKHVAEWVPFPSRPWLLLRRSGDDPDEWVGFGWYRSWQGAVDRMVEVARADEHVPAADGKG